LIGNPHSTIGTMVDAIVIGGGHNGLVAASYLARAGLRTIVLERREVAGGTAATGEVAPGFRCSTLAHAAGPLRPSIVADLALARHGLVTLIADPAVVALDPEGRALAFHGDEATTARHLAAFSTRDAERYRGFAGVLQALGAFLRPLLDAAPPAVDEPGGRDLWAWLLTGRRFRALGRENGFRLLRYMPMGVADLVDEWLEADLARAAVAVRGVLGTSLGPRAAGTGANLLLAAAAEPAPAGGTVLVRGGLGALSDALTSAARSFGVEIRTGTEVARVLVDGRRAVGVALETGEEIRATVVVSNADPKRTLLNLVEPHTLDPEFSDRVSHIRTSGASAKVNLALDRLPSFTALADCPPQWLAGRLHIGPTLDALERTADAAKYGELPEEPFLDVTIPSISDPALAPPGRHVLSAYVPCVPCRLQNGDWQGAGERLGDIVVRTLARYAPDLPDLVLARQVLTPADLERDYALTGGHPSHGDAALDQLFVSRPLFGWARYRTPVQGLYLCGAGTHPGGGVTGAPGANAAREIVRDFRQVRRS
jgi:phytoene dehydrogenase-like protein